MKTQRTLKSLSQLSIEQLAIAASLPPPAISNWKPGVENVLPPNAPLVTTIGEEDFARMRPIPTRSDKPASWKHWGLNE